MKEQNQAGLDESDSGGSTRATAGSSPSRSGAGLSFVDRYKLSVQVHHAHTRFVHRFFCC